jgi:lipoprotein-anchoring transpeptidase ErfK/SrfK
VASTSLLLVLAVGGCTRGQATNEAVASDGITRPVVAASPPTWVVTTPALPSGCSGRAIACVSTRHRVAWLQQVGRPAYGPVPVALGSASQPTPHGTFHVAWKDEEHTSSRYGTDMPYSVFFAAGGVAFHEGPLDETSHGCVHLTAVAAAAFFAALDRGDRVEIF